MLQKYTINAFGLYYPLLNEYTHKKCLKDWKLSFLEEKGSILVIFPLISFSILNAQAYDIKERRILLTTFLFPHFYLLCHFLLLHIDEKFLRASLVSFMFQAILFTAFLIFLDVSIYQIKAIKFSFTGNPMNITWKFPILEISQRIPSIHKVALIFYLRSQNFFILHLKNWLYFSEYQIYRADLVNDFPLISDGKKESKMKIFFQFTG